MSRLLDLSKDKNTILMRLLESQSICKALKYGDIDFLDKPDVENPHELTYKNIFPYHFVPQTTTEKGTFITLLFGRYRLVRNSFKSGIVRIHVFTHADLHRTNYGFLRCDLIAHEIEEMMNGKRGIGVMKPTFKAMDSLYINPDYSGLWIDYQLYEWN